MLKDLEKLAQHFYLTIISSDDTDFRQVFAINCTSVQINIPRKISLLEDIKALFLLTKFFKKNYFDIVLSVTPKAGLLAMLSAFLLRVPKRVHYFTGQVWANKIGFRRFLLKNVDKLVAKLATQILVAGRAQRQFLIQQKIISQHKSTTLFHGVDTQKFLPNATLKKQLRKQYQLSEVHIVFMFLGRINKDKGIIELIAVMGDLLAHYKKLAFFLVGEDEGDIDSEVLKIFAVLDRVFVLGKIEHPEQVLNLADVVVLPSHREGFSFTPFEAAAMKIPSITSDIYGLKDSVVAGQTGLIHRVQDKQDMVEKYTQLITDKKLRKQLGENAYRRATSEFNQDKTSQLFIQYFLS